MMCLHPTPVSFQLIGKRRDAASQPSTACLGEKQLPPLEAALVSLSTTSICTPSKEASEVPQVRVWCLQSQAWARSIPSQPAEPCWTSPSLLKLVPPALARGQKGAVLLLLCLLFIAQSVLHSNDNLPPCRDTNPSSLLQWPSVTPACCRHAAVAGEGHAANAGSCAVSHAELEAAPPSLELAVLGTVLPGDKGLKETARGCGAVTRCRWLWLHPEMQKEFGKQTVQGNGARDF